MKKNYFVLPLVITPCLVQNAVAQEKGEQRPNVVFIYADDIGFGDFVAMCEYDSYSQCRPCGSTRRAIY